MAITDVSTATVIVFAPSLYTFVIPVPATSAELTASCDNSSILGICAYGTFPEPSSVATPLATPLSASKI